MEPLEAAADEVDDFLLNFSEDLFLDPNMSSSPSLFQDTQRQQQHTENQVGPAEQLGQQLQTAEQQQHGEPARRLLPLEDPFLANFPPVEGELDWLTRGSGFQSFSFIPVTGPTTAASKPHKKQQDPEVVASSEPKRPSPVSVLEAASGNWPVRKRSKARQRIRTNLSVFPVDQQLLLPAEATSGGGSAVTRRSCSHCKVEDTPQWRAGPEGPKTLCNACGVRYKSGRLVPEYRPANSPTFSSAVHSNSHRKIIEMRRNKSGSPPLLQPSLLGPAGSSAAPPAVMNIRKKKKRKKKEEEDAVHRMVVASFAV